MADYPMAQNDFFDGGGLWIFALLILLLIGNGGLFGGTSNALSQQDLQRAIAISLPTALVRVKKCCGSTLTWTLSTTASTITSSSVEVLSV